VAQNPLIQPDPGLFIWTIVTFLVLLWLLSKFAWGPLLAALDKRQKTIESAVENARKAREELEHVKQEAARMLAEARREGDGLVQRARSDADRLREELRQKAISDAATITRNAERQIQQETARALGQIREEAVDLSLDIASKILRRVVSRQDHEQLIDDVVREVGTSGAGGDLGRH
jgi:F-type H+-transporting ATPase subunit b